MRSIPCVMTWELLRHGRWQMLMAFLGANLLSLLILMGLRVHGPIDPDDQGLIVVQLILIELQPVLFAVAILASIHPTSRFYTLPVSASTIVAWKMIPAMVLIFLQSIASTAALNWLFGLHWPLWGPAFLSSVSLAMIFAALWYAERSIYLPFCVAFGALIIGLWYKSRWGPISNFPNRIWSTVTVPEMATMLLFAVASYFVAVVGISRSRCGETLGATFDWTWLEKIVNGNFQHRADGTGRFETPQAAHFWCEWTKKGWLLPAVVLLGLVFGVAGWTALNRDPADLIDGLVGGGMMLSCLGMLGGIVIGNTGAVDTNYEMGSFLGTRPLSDRDLSTITLKVLGRSVLISWLFWCIAFVGVASLQWLSGDLGRSLNFRSLHWWYLPVTLLGAWIANATVASLSLTGQNSMWVRLIASVFAGYIGLAVISKFQGYDTQQRLVGVTVILTGIAMGAISVALLVAALRRSAINLQTALAASIIWSVLSAAIVIEAFRLHVPPSAIVLLIGIVSFSVSPLAAAPLAVAWNRHR